MLALSTLEFIKQPGKPRSDEPAAAGSPPAARRVAMNNPPAGRLCPHCHRFNETITSACQACHRLFPVSVRPVIQRQAQSGEVASMQADLLELAAEADAPADTRGQPGKFRLRFFIVTVLAGASLLTAFMRSTFGADAAGIAVVLFVVLLVIWLVMLIRDLLVPSARARRTSQAAVRCFFMALKYGRFDVAHACISPVGRKTVPFPHTRELIVRHGEANLDTKSGVKSYWRAIARSTWDTVRVMATPVIAVTAKDKLHRCRVTLNITHFPAWVYLGLLLGVLPALILQLVMQKKYTATFDVTVHQYRSQWWVVTGEFNSPVDSEIDIALGQA